MLYKTNEIVFAKCQDYPFWPGKIVHCFPQAASYKVVFYGEKSEATISEACMLPFNDEVIRKLSADSALRNYKELQHSIKIACKRLQKRRKGLASSSEEEDYFMDSQPPKRSQAQELQKLKRIVHYKTPEDPHLELSFLLNNLGHEAAAFSQSKTIGSKFTPEHEARLKQLLDPSFGLQLANLIEYKVIEKFIIVLKEIDLWGLKVYPQLGKLVRDRYQQYKSFILSEEFNGVPLREARREILIQKVTLNKAVL